MTSSQEKANILIIFYGLLHYLTACVEVEYTDTGDLSTEDCEVTESPVEILLLLLPVLTLLSIDKHHVPLIASTQLMLFVFGFFYPDEFD